MSAPNLLYTYYGDDFTGSTDALEQLALNGVTSALFLAPPQPEHLAHFPNLRAFGIAGDSRSRSPTWMREHLLSIFTTLRSFAAPITHYKVCSTFDSSPSTGNIGCALELGLEAFNSRFAPIVVGAPHLRRFVLEGSLFAAAPDGQIHRIDRHPMSRHPVTPMREPDLRRHLAAQTSFPIGLVDHNALASPASASAALEHELAQHTRAVLFDTVDAGSQQTIGHFLWNEAQTSPLFAVGSSGFTAALIAAWRELGLIAATPLASTLEPAHPLLVISGSCSAATEQQIRWATAHGFHSIAIDVAQLLTRSTSYREQLLTDAVQALNAKHDLILHTALGQATLPTAGHELGIALGALSRDLRERTNVQRIVFCGGDTSSHAVQQLGLFALTCIAGIQPGAPLCRAHFLSPQARPLELVLKGGQAGAQDFFAAARGIGL